MSDINWSVQPQKIARDLKLRTWRGCTIFVAKAKALISSVVTSQLICAYVFAYVKSRLSYDAAQIVMAHYICTPMQ